MAEHFTCITPAMRAFIERQHLFFVATAPREGEINLSPKGRLPLRVLGPNCVAYADYPGSGNETATHLRENGRICIMLCSFERTPGIVRLHGRGRVLGVDELGSVEGLAEALAPDLREYTRQVIVVDVHHTQTSCGFAVPRFEYVAERLALDNYCEKHLAKQRAGRRAAGEEG